MRVALAECLGALARHSGPRVFECCGPAIVSTINACFVRHHLTALERCICNAFDGLCGSFSGAVCAAFVDV